MAKKVSDSQVAGIKAHAEAKNKETIDKDLLKSGGLELYTSTKEVKVDGELVKITPIDFKILAMLPHQVFGLFTGTLILDDGKIIEIKESLGFAEKVHNKW